MSNTAIAYDQVDVQHRMLLDAISKGLLVPVLGGDINLCGRPLQDQIPISWEHEVDGMKFPPTTIELALHLLNEATQEKYQKDLDPYIVELLKHFLATQLSSPQDSMSSVGLANVSQYIHFVNEDILDGILPQILSQQFRPTPVHDFLVKLAQYHPNPPIPGNCPYPCIVTACFDQVLEQQLRKNKVPFHLVSFVLGENGGVFQYTGPGALPGAASQVLGTSAEVTELMAGLREHAVVIKLNGGLPSGWRNFAITEDHYIDYLSHQGLKESLPEMISAKLTKRGKTESSHLLFMGYSLRHWSLRVILRRIWSESLSSTNKSWTVIMEERFSHIDAQFWKDYGLAKDLWKIDSLDSYIKRLSDKLTVVLSPANESAPQQPMVQKRNRVFISYSHEDQDFFEELKTMLYPITQKYNIWHDQMIQPGAPWREEIKDALALAKVAILLVSPDFLRSDFIEKNELPPLLEKPKANACRLLWIKVKESLVVDSPIEAYQALHAEPALVALTPAERNRAMYAIATRIRDILNET
jgi:hypothetical protein